MRPANGPSADERLFDSVRRVARRTLSGGHRLRIALKTVPVPVDASVHASYAVLDLAGRIGVVTLEVQVLEFSQTLSTHDRSRLRQMIEQLLPPGMPLQVHFGDELEFRLDQDRLL